MVYQLYGERGSGAGIVEAALAAIGEPYLVHEVSLRSEQQRSAEYERLNPQRKLPTLVTPAGETLTESAAILIVLDERHPGARLFPALGSPERAQALRWLLFLATEIYPLVEINDYPERFAPPGVAPAAMRERAREIWRQRWLVLESQIGGDPWLSPAGFAFTDVYLAALSRWASQGAWRPAHVPRVEKNCGCGRGAARHRPDLAAPLPERPVKLLRRQLSAAPSLGARWVRTSPGK